MKPEYVDDYEQRLESPRDRTLATSGDQALEDKIRFIATANTNLAEFESSGDKPT